eukprot:5843008-Pleurochrysis_carterae.AAC.1
MPHQLEGRGATRTRHTVQVTVDRLESVSVDANAGLGRKHDKWTCHDQEEQVRGLARTDDGARGQTGRSGGWRGAR